MDRRNVRRGHDGRGATGMTERPTSFDIAQLAGVSQPTVSRALRGSPNVSEPTRRRIQAIAQELGYAVDKNASNLRSQHSNTLALLLFEDPSPDHSSINPFFLSMLGSITRNCVIRGYDLLVSFQELSSNWHHSYQFSGRADGIILLGYGDYEEYRWRLDELVRNRTRFVRWGSVQEGQPGLTVGCDNVRGGRDITAHLLAQGRRRLAFLGTASAGAPEFLDRYRGHCDALSAAGLTPSPDLQRDSVSSEEAGYAAAMALIDSGCSFDGVTCASDLIAIGAMRALQERGLRVPEDVAVTGFDDILAAAYTHPPLTTVMQDAAAAGEALVETLVRQIHKEPAQGATLPVRTVIRRSCGAGV